MCDSTINNNINNKRFFSDFDAIDIFNDEDENYDKYLNLDNQYSNPDNESDNKTDNESDNESEIDEIDNLDLEKYFMMIDKAYEQICERSRLIKATNGIRRFLTTITSDESDESINLENSTNSGNFGDSTNSDSNDKYSNSNIDK